MAIGGATLVGGCGLIALVVTLTACGSSDSNTASTSSVSSTTSAAARTSSAMPSVTDPAPEAGPPYPTVGDYLRQNNIGQTFIHRGDAGTPQLNLPMPPGWIDTDSDAPADAWGAIALESGGTDNPPAIIATMARLQGTVDTEKILALAPNAVRNQPGYQGPQTGTPGQLGGFDAVQIAGTVEQNGQTTMIARKVVVIPSGTTVYLLALDAQGPVDQEQALTDAMSVIDNQTTIAP